MRLLRASLLPLVAALFVSTSASAQTSVVVTPAISGNDLTAQIDLAGGFSADIAISFEQAVGLNTSALAITASLVDPLDATLLSRLPGSVGVPAGFPVVVRIEPTAASALSFSGVYKLTLHTHNLTLQAASPLRLYRAPSGGAFKDMTGFLEMGSVRAGGSGPGFSEFLIAADVRPVDAVISGKLDNLSAALTASAAAIAPSVYSDLSTRLSSIRNLIATGAIPAAIDAVTSFSAAVKSQSGAAIPDVWRANASLANVAGALRSAADTLRFSLVVKSNTV
ncbi:MAG TPA: DUF6689 family protein [Thermoanaerobaculia bacterium]|nr:DUF6689 family protein [Thermoanaerobaculia bacterium]